MGKREDEAEKLAMRAGIQKIRQLPVFCFFVCFSSSSIKAVDSERSLAGPTKRPIRICVHIRLYQKAWSILLFFFSFFVSTQHSFRTLRFCISNRDRGTVITLSEVIIIITVAGTCNSYTQLLASPSVQKFLKRLK